MANYSREWYAQSWENDDGGFEYFATQGSKIDDDDPVFLAYGTADTALDAESEIRRALMETLGDNK